jgi:hypothetical protein
MSPVLPPVGCGTPTYQRGTPEVRINRVTTDVVGHCGRDADFQLVNDQCGRGVLGLRRVTEQERA